MSPSREPENLGGGLAARGPEVGKAGAGWLAPGAWLLRRLLHSLLEFLRQVPATDFQFAKQNKFALIGKIHRKDCLDFSAAA